MKKRGPLFWLLVVGGVFIAIGLCKGAIQSASSTNTATTTQATTEITEQSVQRTDTPIPTATPKPKTLDQQINDTVQGAGLFGKDIKTSRDAQFVTVKDNLGDGSYTNSMTVHEIKHDCFKAQQALWTQLPSKIPEVIVNVYMNVVDRYGNESNKEVASCDLQKNTEQQFNWSNLTYDQAWDDYDNKHIASFLTQ